MRTGLLIILLCFSWLSAAIELTRIPGYVYSSTTPIPLGWTGGEDSVKLYSAQIPGGSILSNYLEVHAGSFAPTDSVDLVYGTDVPLQYQPYDLREGANYCVLSDGENVSQEFIITFSRNIAAQLLTPANGDSVQELTPIFSWNGQAPYYTILLSDRPFVITEEGTVENANIIWRYTTEQQSVYYGERDADVGDEVPPPLLSGRLYYWMVANTYDKTSNAISQVISDIYAFTYDVPAPESPVILSPADGDTLNDSAGFLEFRWQESAGAVSYRVYLMEQNLINGSDGRIAVWDQSTNEPYAMLQDPSGILRNLDYYWRVFAYDAQGGAVESEEFRFNYDVPAGELEVKVNDSISDEGIPLAMVDFRRIPGEYHAFNSQSVTELSGYVGYENLPYRTYSITASKNGYESRTALVNFADSHRVVRIKLPPLNNRAYGVVRDAETDQAVSEALVRFESLDYTDLDPVTVRTNVSGGYSVGLVSGQWMVYVDHNDYESIVPRTFEISSQDSVQAHNFNLTPKEYQLSGIIRNAYTGNSLNEVSISFEQNGEVQNAVSRGDGSYQLGVSAGSAVIRLSKTGYRYESFFLEINSDIERDFSMEPGASTIGGSVTDTSLNLMEGVSIRALSGTQEINVETDTRGEFELSLPAGDWTLQATRRGYTSNGLQRVLLEESRDLEVNFIMTANPSLVRGMVYSVEADGLQPLSGAEVFLLGTETTVSSASDGSFLFYTQPGNLELSARKAGYSFNETVSFSLVAGDTLSGVSIAGVPNAATVSGVAANESGNMPGVRIVFLKRGTSISNEVFTSELGTYEISLSGGTYEIYADRDGYLSDTLVMTLALGGQYRNVNLNLRENSAVVSGVVRSQGVVLGSQFCRVEAVSAGDSLQAPVNWQGNYQVQLEAGRSWNMQSHCQGYEASGVHNVFLVAGSDTSVSFEMEPLESFISGALTLEGSTWKIPDVRVKLLKNEELVGEQFSNTEGEWQFSLSLGSYVLEFSKDRYQTATRSLDVLPGDSLTGLSDTLGLVPLSSILGYIQSDEGRAVGGAEVRLTASDSKEIFTMESEASGRFYFSDLPADLYTLEISAENHSSYQNQIILGSGENVRHDVQLQVWNSSIRGVVADGSGNAVSGALISIQGGEVYRTAYVQSGAFSFDSLPGGNFRIDIVQSGYDFTPSFEEFSLGWGQSDSSFVFDALPRSSVLTLVPQGIGNTAALEFRLVSESGVEYYGRSGDVWVFDLSPGNYGVEVLTSGVRIVSGDSVNVQSASASHTVQLENAETIIRGAIRNQDGALLSSDASLSLSLRDVSGSLSETRQVSGNQYSFSPVPVGQSYRLRCLSDRYQCDDYNIALGMEQGDSLTRNIVVRDFGTVVSGSAFLNENGGQTPIRNQLITLSGAGNGSRNTYTDTLGNFAFTEVAGSSVDSIIVECIHSEGAVRRAMIVSAGDTADGLSLGITPVRVTVRDRFENQLGQVISGKRVRAVNGTLDTLLTTDGEGKIELSGLRPFTQLQLRTVFDSLVFENVFHTRQLGSATEEQRVHSVTESSSFIRLVNTDSLEVMLDGGELNVSGDTLEIGYLSSGSFQISVQRSGYEVSPAETLITLNLRDTAEFSYSHQQLVGAIQGNVYSGVYSGAYRRESGALVTMSGDGGNFETRSVSGGYSFNNLTAGNYLLSISQNGLQSFSDSIAIDGGVVIRSDTLSAYTGSIRGRVSESGAAQSGVNVILKSGGSVYNRITDSFGYFNLRGLPAQVQVVISASSGDLAVRDTSVLVPVSGARYMDLNLRSWGGVSGHLVNGESGENISGALVQLLNTGSGLQKQVNSDSSGAYAFSGLDNGDYRVTVSKDGFSVQQNQRMIEVEGLQRLTGIDFTLEPLLTGITGVITNESAQGISQNIGLIQNADTVWGRSDASGNYLFSQLQSGIYVLYVNRAGYDVSLDTVDYSTGLVTRNIALQPVSNTVQGRVIDRVSGSGIDSADVYISVGAENFQLLTDSSGYFTFVHSGNENSFTVDSVIAGDYNALRGDSYELDSFGGASINLTLYASYSYDGHAGLIVMAGEDTLENVTVRLVSDHPNDEERRDTEYPISFNGLRYPSTYQFIINHEDRGSLSASFVLNSERSSLDTLLYYPSSSYGVVTVDSQGRIPAKVWVNSEELQRDSSGAGLYVRNELSAGIYGVSVSPTDADFLRVKEFSLNLGDAQNILDTIGFYLKRIAFPDTVLQSTLSIQDTAASLNETAVLCSLFIKAPEAAEYSPYSVSVQSEEYGLKRVITTPQLDIPGVYRHYLQCVESGILRGEDLVYTGRASPDSFRVVDPVKLSDARWSPERYADGNLVLPYNSKLRMSLNILGENARNLNPWWDANAAENDSASITWGFSDSATAAQLGLSFELRGVRGVEITTGNKEADGEVEFFGRVELKGRSVEKKFLFRVNDMQIVKIGIRYNKLENPYLQTNELLPLPLNSKPEEDYQFSAFARSRDSVEFPIYPQWKLEGDTLLGNLSEGLYSPDSAVIGRGWLSIRDSLLLWKDSSGVSDTISFRAPFAQYFEVFADTAGVAVFGDGDGFWMRVPRAALVANQSAQVFLDEANLSNSIKALPTLEAVGKVYDITVYPPQPFKLDSGAYLDLPVEQKYLNGNKKMYLAHWSGVNIEWEMVDSVVTDTSVGGKAVSFSPYAVMAESDPLGAYGFEIMPNPFTPLDPWALQFDYQLSSNVSSRVQVQIHLYNMNGDLVYESRKVSLAKNQKVSSGTYQRVEGENARTAELAPYLWDGRTTDGRLCRNGRYILKLTVSDRSGSKTYLRKVVLLK
jgi:hypothetical protein